jgi:hypothetical protein
MEEERERSKDDEKVNRRGERREGDLKVRTCSTRSESNFAN